MFTRGEESAKSRLRVELEPDPFHAVYVSAAAAYLEERVALLSTSVRGKVSVRTRRCTCQRKSAVAASQATPVMPRRNSTQPGGALVD